MTTTLSEGVKVPDVGSVNWAGDLEVNWNLLNGALANLSGNVKTDRDNTWTGEQSFTLPIVGSITGTASKAIADEDGTSIKTGYVNVAGNQTVSGQKTWSSNAFFTAIAYHRNNNYEIGNTSASNIAIPIYFTDKSNVYTGYVRNVVLATGRTHSELLARNKFTNGTLSPTGTDITSSLQVEVNPNGTKSLYFDGSIRNNVLPYATNTYSLGSSSYQWSSVYAQSYYYNGTAWGLDKANVWSGYNTFTNYITSQESAAIPAGGYGKGIAFRDYQNNRFGYIQPCLTSDSAKRLLIGVDSGDIASNSNIIPNANNSVNLGTSTNKWKTLNGINPGALSFPGSSYIDISGDITARDASAPNSLTALCDGWIAINSFATWLQISDDTTLMATTGAIGADGFAQVFLPVRQGDSIRVVINQTNTQFQSFRLIPCQGNV